MEDFANRMKLWIDSAKSCSQLATAAMFLPIFWMRELVAIGKDKPLLLAIDDSFVFSWAAFIAAIALSHTYQISAIKLITTGGVAPVLLFPRTQYWLMVFSLVVGMGFFAHGALKERKLGSIPPAAASQSQSPASAAKN